MDAGRCFLFVVIMAKKNSIITKNTISPEEIEIIGIEFPFTQEYKMAFLLNKSLDISLSRLDDFRHDNGEDIAEHALYTYYDEDERLAYYLINAKYPKPILMKSSGLDFLLIIENENDQFTSGIILDKIRAIEGVFFAGKLDVAKIPTLNILMEDLELFLLELAKKNKRK